MTTREHVEQVIAQYTPISKCCGAPLTSHFVCNDQVAQCSACKRCEICGDGYEPDTIPKHQKYAPARVTKPRGIRR